MCDCSDKIVNLETLKIYTLMGTYKALIKSGVSSKGDFRIEWAVASQEELAYAYEELGMTGAIEKLSTTKTENDSKKATKKKKSSKDTDSKE